MSKLTDYEKLDRNLFRYASSELSQDAFLPWFFSHANDPGCEIGMAARDYLISISGFTKLAFECIEKIEVMTQLKLSIPGVKRSRRADLVILIHAGDAHYVVLIEDKTHSSDSSDKLKDYELGVREHFRELETLEGVSLLFFKSGYITRKERLLCEKCEYKIVAINGLLNVLEPLSGRSEVISNYCDWISSQRSWSVSAKKLFMEGDFEAAANDPILRKYFPNAMFEVLETVMENLVGDFPVYGFETTDDCCAKDRWKLFANMSGEPCSQLDVAFKKDCYRLSNSSEPCAEYLFYRIDRKKRGYYLSINQWARPKSGKTDEFIQLKRKRLEELRAIAKSANEALGLFEFNNARGIYESEVCILYFSDRLPIQIASDLEVFHGRFIEGLKKLD